VPREGGRKTADRRHMKKKKDFGCKNRYQGRGVGNGSARGGGFRPGKKIPGLGAFKKEKTNVGK